MCKSRWYSLRDQYRKRMKKKNTEKKPGHGSVFNKKWKYETEMNFLQPFFRTRDTSYNTTYDEEQDAAVTEENSIDLKEEPASDPCDDDQDFNCHSEKSAHVEAPTLMDFLVKQKRETDALLGTDPVEAFFSGIIAKVKRFSPYYQNIVESQIFTIVQEIEMKQIMEVQNLPIQHPLFSLVASQNVQLHRDGFATSLCSPAPSNSSAVTYNEKFSPRDDEDKT